MTSQEMSLWSKRSSIVQWFQREFDLLSWVKLRRIFQTIWMWSLRITMRTRVFNMSRYISWLRLKRGLEYKTRWIQQSRNTIDSFLQWVLERNRNSFLLLPKYLVRNSIKAHKNPSWYPIEILKSMCQNDSNSKETDILSKHITATQRLFWRKRTGLKKLHSTFSKVSRVEILINSPLIINNAIQVWKSHRCSYW